MSPEMQEAVRRQAAAIREQAASLAAQANALLATLDPPAPPAVPASPPSGRQAKRRATAEAVRTFGGPDMEDGDDDST